MLSNVFNDLQPFRKNMLSFQSVEPQNLTVPTVPKGSSERLISVPERTPESTGTVRNGRKSLKSLHLTVPVNRFFSLL
jgi:hypothetical protein